MVVTNLIDLAVELLNECKVSMDAKTKLYYLMQVRELLLHREPALLPALIQDICELMLDPNPSLRKFLIKFGGEAVKKSPSVVPHVLPMLSFFANDANEDMDMTRAIALELKPIYPQVVLTIASLPIKSKATADPKVLWTQLRAVVDKVIDCIASNKAEGIRSQSIRFLESIIQFGIPVTETVTAKVLDPRLKAKKEAAVAVDVTSAEISLSHPFISRTDIEQEAESHFSKLLLWASRGGPQSHPFSPALMSQLGQTLANVASLRHRLLAQASPAVLSILGKAGLCEDMSGGSREHLAKALHRLMRSLTFQSDAASKAVVPKIRSFIEHLEGLGFVEGGAAKPSKVVSRKRDLSAVDEVEEEEDDLETVEIRANAKLALESAESSMKVKQVKSAGTSSTAAVPLAGGAFSSTGESELPQPTQEFRGYETSERLAEVVTAASSAGVGELSLQPLPCSSSTYKQLAMQSLWRLLTTGAAHKNTPEQV